MRVNDLELHVEVEGDGEPVLLLHGWPDSSFLWRHQMPALAAAGFRAIAPDLRGFGRSDKPQDVEAYTFSNLMSDVVGIMDGLGVERAHLVGHDWGAALAWQLAIDLPERVDRLVVLSVPHPAVPRGLDQLEKAWYQLFFMFQEVAEAWLRHDDWDLFRKLMRGNGDMDRYLTDLARPGALRASLNWYRANLAPRPPGRPREYPPVTAPTLAIWSSGDHYLVEDRVIESERHVAGPWRYVRLEGVSHWIPLDAPERLNGLLIDWLGPSRGRSTDGVTGPR